MDMGEIRGSLNHQVLGSLGLILLDLSTPLSVKPFWARKSYSCGVLRFCGLSRPRTATPVPEAASASPLPSPDLAKTLAQKPPPAAGAAFLAGAPRAMATTCE